MKKHDLREDYLEKVYIIDELLNQRTYRAIADFDECLENMLNIGRVNSDYNCYTSFKEFKEVDEIIKFNGLRIIIKKDTTREDYCSWIYDPRETIAIIELDLLEDRTFKLNKQVEVNENIAYDSDEYILMVIRYLNEKYLK